MTVQSLYLCLTKTEIFENIMSHGDGVRVRKVLKKCDVLFEWLLKLILLVAPPLCLLLQLSFAKRHFRSIFNPFSTFFFCLWEFVFRSSIETSRSWGSVYPFLFVQMKVFWRYYSFIQKYDNNNQKILLIDSFYRLFWCRQYATDSIINDPIKRCVHI